ENEQAALAVPARFLGRIHPHYREVVQFLAIQVADEARHMEVFARRAGLNGQMPGTSTVGGRASLATLLAEPDFALASFLLSVLGEGTFLNLLSFLEQHGPDGVTRDVTGLARQDETRHVAFAMGHLEFQLGLQAELRDRMRAAVERRYEALRTTSGLSEDVFDSLVILSAGSWEPAAIAAGHDAVARLERDMAEGRERRLIRLGFPSSEASTLSSLHTRNFM
ncbi:MAG TPA: ferritin-like domain-containing protein, partial [Dehalococcoidia bacterium]|nr:ferritin-like domain-containing protein [Dehalococcoidia bacterium]